MNNHSGVRSAYEEDPSQQGHCVLDPLWSRTVSDLATVIRPPPKAAAVSEFPCLPMVAFLSAKKPACSSETGRAGFTAFPFFISYLVSVRTGRPLEV